MTEVDAKKAAAHATRVEFKKKWDLVPANHPLLSTKLENFDLKNPPVDPVELATDMLAHMRHYGGIGLSANINSTICLAVVLLLYKYASSSAASAIAYTSCLGS